MNKSELESKHIAELHELAAEAGVERYRMLSRAELIEKLAGGGGGGSAPKPKRERSGADSGQRRQRNRSRKPRDGRGDREPRGERQQRKPREGQNGERQRQPAPPREPATAGPGPGPAAAAPERPKRKRRRRRWGRRRKGLRLNDLLLPAASGRQAIVYAESRATCTTLLREVAAEMSSAPNAPDPIALLVDPTPEELADWKREAPQAEIVSAGKANHAGDAIAQARTRAAAGEEVIVLIDSLTRFAESFGGADEARALLDAGPLTVVAALERN